MGNELDEFSKDMILALKPRLHQRNIARNKQHVACCRQQNCCADEQHVAGNKQLVAGMLLDRATCCRATCCAGVNAA